MNLQSKTLRKKTQSIKNKLNTLENKIEKPKEDNMSKLVSSLAQNNRYKERIIIDITNFLKKYYNYFNYLEEQLGRITKKLSYSDNNTQKIISSIDFGINDINGILTKNINLLRRHYERIGLTEDSDEMKNLKNFENGHATLLNDLEYYKNVANNVANSNSKKISTATISKNKLNSSKKNNWFPSFDFLFSSSISQNKTGGGKKKKNNEK